MKRILVAFLMVGLSVNLHSASAGWCNQSIVDQIYANLLVTVPPAPASLDFNHDGIVDISDYSICVANWDDGSSVSGGNEGATSGSTGEETPPSTDVMLEATTSVRVRSNPSTNSNRIGAIEPGTQHRVVGKNANSHWLQIEFNGATGWVCASFVTTNLSTFPVAVTDNSSETCNVTTATPVPDHQDAAQDPGTLLERPENCSASNIIVQNTRFASVSVEATFCEGDIPGQGSLWLFSHSTIAHLVKIFPDAGVENIGPVSGFIWGPNYDFPIASNVRIEPGEQIRIEVSRFGDDRQEAFAALQIHTALITELLYIGNTPRPNEGTTRYWILLLEQIPFLDIGKNVELLNNCNSAIESSNPLDITTCILSISQERSILENIREVLRLFNIRRTVEDLGLAFEALSVTVEMGTNLGQIGLYIFELSRPRQDGVICISHSVNQSRNGCD